MNEVDFLRGIEGEEQQGTDLVSGAEQLVRLKIQSGQQTQPKYDDLELEKKANIKDVAKTVLEGAKGGLKYQHFGAGAGLAGMKADKPRAVGHLLGMAAPAAAVGMAGYAAGHHAGQEKQADLSESIGSAAMCKSCGKVKEACPCPKTKMAYEIQPSDRPDIPRGDFAQPHKEEAGHEGKYPIPDRQHARSALGFAKMHHDSGALAAVRHKIEQKYPDMIHDHEKTATAVLLKEALLEKLATAPEWNKAMLAATTGLGALAGGLGTYLASRPQEDTGKSKMEEDLGAAVKANKGKPERGFLQKLKNREVESAHGIARVFREHPVKASLLGTATGAAGGYGIGQLGGAISRLRGGK